MENKVDHHKRLGRSDPSEPSAVRSSSDGYPPSLPSLKQLMPDADFNKFLQAPGGGLEKSILPSPPRLGIAQEQQVTHQNLSVVDTRLSEHASPPSTASVGPNIFKAGTITPGGYFVGQEEIDALEALRVKYPERNPNEVTPYDRAIGRTEPGNRRPCLKLTHVARALAVVKGWDARTIQRELFINSDARYTLANAIRRIRDTAQVNEHDAPPQAESSGTVRGLPPRPKGREGR